MSHEVYSSRPQTSKLDLDLKKKRTWKLVCDYASIYFIFINCHQRGKFPRGCLENDNIHNFLRLRVPENGMFSDQAVHNFQTRLLGTEINQGKDR